MLSLDRQSARHPVARSVRQNTIWNFIGSSIYSACGWAALISLTKISSPASVGAFTFGIAVTTPVFLFSQLQLRQIQATDARREYRFEDFLSIRLVTTMVAILGILVFLLFTDLPLKSQYLLVIMSFGKGFDSLCDVVYGRLQAEECMHSIAQAMIINGLLSFALLFFGVYVTGSILVGSAGWAAASAITLVIVVAQRRGADALSLDSRSVFTIVTRQLGHWTRLRKLVTLAVPLGIGMMLLSLNAMIPRYFVEHFLGDHDLGIFAAMSYVLVVGNTLVTAIGQASSPRLARLFASADYTGFTKVIVGNLLIGTALSVIMVVGASLFGKLLLSRLYSPEYAEHPNVFLWIIVASAFSYLSSLVGFGITAAGLFKIQAPLFLGVNLVTVVASALLIPHYGLEGAAFSMAISMGFLFLLCAVTLIWALWSRITLVTHHG